MATRANQIKIINAAARRYGIRPSDLWGIYGVETSFGSNVSTSSAGAVGPFQFLPGTARSIGVNPYNFTSAAYGAAKYLNQLGYSRNPTRAIAAYNGGPGNPQYSYASQVRRLGGGWGGASRGILGGGGGGAAPRPKPASPGVAGLGAPNPNSLTPGGSGLTTLLAGQQAATNQQQRPLAPATSPLPNPVFSASHAVPGFKGMAEVPAVGPPIPPQDTLGQQLSQLQSARGPDITQLGGVSVTGGSGGGGGAAPRAHGHPYYYPISGHHSVGRTDNGVDFETTPGSALLAIGAGRIVSTQGPFPGGSIILRLDHPYHGFQYVYYGHLNDGDKRVRPGQRVNPGQIIARTSRRPAGAEDLPGHTEIGFSRPDGSIFLRGHAEGSTAWGRTFRNTVVARLPRR